MSRGRLSPPDSKEGTQGLAIKAMPAPSEVVLPLSQHTGAPAQEKVSAGEKVCVGTMVAQAQGQVSVPLHSSVSGEVKAVENRPHPVLGHCRAIVIASDGQDTPDGSIAERDNALTLSADEIREIVRNCGVVGLGGAGFPTHIKLKPPAEKKIDTFILNGAECEPFLTADHRLMLEKANEIIAGMRVIMQALGVSSAIVAIEENKPDVVKVFEGLIDRETMRVAVLESFYPQGAEKQLIKSVLHREVPPRGLPFDVGVIVNNAATAYAVYEAVYKNKPLYERVITVSGKIVRNPGNLLVRLGTKVKDILEFCGGLTEEPGKVILGGPMMGIAQYTLDVPVIKGTSGIIVFDKKESRVCLDQPCIRCGRCIQVCPMGLNPSAISQAIEKGDFKLAEEYHVLDCIECGICSYLCPSNRNVVALVKLAKQKLKKK